MKFGAVNLCLNPQRNYEFHENQCSESQILLMGITKIFCPTVYIFRPIWTQFGTREEVTVSFVKIGVVKATIHLRVYMNINLYFPNFVRVEIWHSMSAHIAVQFRRVSSKAAQGRAHSCYGANKITFTRVP